VVILTDISDVLMVTDDEITETNEVQVIEIGMLVIDASINNTDMYPRTEVTFILEFTNPRALIGPFRIG
jgi:hypothetical protein